jgi:hypothetical protein
MFQIYALGNGHLVGLHDAFGLRYPLPSALADGQDEHMNRMALATTIGAKAQRYFLSFTRCLKANGKGYLSTASNQNG